MALTGETRGAFHELRVLKDGTMQDVLTLVGGGADLSDYYTEAEVDARIQLETNARNLLATNTASALASKATAADLATEVAARVALASATTTSLAAKADSTAVYTKTQVDTQLAMKQDELAASDGVTIDNQNVIKSAVTVLSDATIVQTSNRLDFRQFVVTPTTDNKVLIDPPSSYFHIDLAYGTSGNVKRLERTADALLWDGAEMASKASVDDERTARQVFQSDTNIVLNTKQTIGNAQAVLRLGTPIDNRDLTKSGAQLAWGSNTLVETPTLAALENYTQAQLDLKQPLLTAGSGISISGTTISTTGGSGGSGSGGSALELAVNGTVQSGVTKLDFLANEAVLSSGTLYLGPPLTTRVGLWFASQADHKDLTQGSGGILKWGTETVAMETIRPYGQFAKAYGQSFGAGYTAIAWDSAPLASGISLNTTTSAFTVSRAGAYHFDVGMRNGLGSNTWHGVSVLTTGGAIVGKSYATGQVTPESAEGHTWHILAELTTDTTYYISLYRQTGMTVSTPGDPAAGYAIAATITYAS